MALAASIAAVGVAASTAGSVISARNARKDAKKQEKRSLNSIADLRTLRQDLTSDLTSGDYLGRFGAEDVFGRRQEELDLGQSVRDAARANIGNLGINQDLAERANTLITEESIRRASQFDPNLRENLRSLSESARDLINGELPEDVVQEITRSRAGLAAAGGIPGSQRNATARDLGLTSLDLQDRGASYFQQVNNIRDQIDPLSRQIGLNQLQLTPAQQIEQDIANRVIRGGADPVASGLLDLDYGGAREEIFAKSKVPVTPRSNSLGVGLSAAGGGLTGLATSGLFSGGGGLGGGIDYGSQRFAPSRWDRPPSSGLGARSSAARPYGF